MRLGDETEGGEKIVVEGVETGFLNDAGRDAELLTCSKSVRPYRVERKQRKGKPVRRISIQAERAASCDIAFLLPGPDDRDPSAIQTTFSTATASCSIRPVSSHALDAAYRLRKSENWRVRAARSTPSSGSSGRCVERSLVSVLGPRTTCVQPSVPSTCRCFVWTLPAIDFLDLEGMVARSGG